MALSPVYGEFRAACKMLSVKSEHSVNACRHDPSIAQRKDLLALPVQAEEKHLLQHLLARHGAERRGSRQVHDGLHVDVVVLCACSFTVFEPPVTEGGGKRYEAYGRQVLTVNDENKDVDAIRMTFGKGIHWQAHAHQMRRRPPGGLLQGPQLPLRLREFGMGAVSNAGPLHRTGLVPHCATFTIFELSVTRAVANAEWRTSGRY